MIKYQDPFGRETIIEVLPSTFNNRVSFVIRKERQSVYESWDVETAKTILTELQQAIKQVE